MTPPDPVEWTHIRACLNRVEARMAEYGQDFETARRAIIGLEIIQQRRLFKRRWK